VGQSEWIILNSWRGRRVDISAVWYLMTIFRRENVWRRDLACSFFELIEVHVAQWTGGADVAGRAKTRRHVIR
jgi:hypothetical protein